MPCRLGIGAGRHIPEGHDDERRHSRQAEGGAIVLIVALMPTRRRLFVPTPADVAPAGLELPAGFVDAGEPLPRAAARCGSAT